MAKKITAMIMLLCLCLALTGCGSKDTTASDSSGKPALSIVAPKSVQFTAGEIAADVTELSIVLADGETQLLSKLSQLKSADFSGSSCVEEIYAWAQANPHVDVNYTVTMPDGTVLDKNAESADLSAIDSSALPAVLSQLKCLPGLKTLELGVERQGFQWAEFDLVRESFPEARLKYMFNIYGMDVDIENTQINLSHFSIDDDCQSLCAAMDRMQDLVYLDMDSCGVPNERMAQIRDAYPHVKVVWRIWFGEWDVYSVRTDVERILASSPSVAGEIYPGNCEALQYCTEVKYLDLGHNTNMTDISFISSMKKLEVAVLSMADWSDATPLASCENLEYLEIQTTQCTDLSPLANLKNLKHLNVAYILDLEDISPLYGLTQLERLWIGCMNHVPYEQVQQMQAAAPNCEINTSVYEDPTGGRWRYTELNLDTYVYLYHPRYIQLRETFGNYEKSAYSYSWNDPLFY